MLSKEDLLSLVESKMSDIFVEQYEELKDKLLTLMAQQVSKLISKVDDIENEFLKFKEDQQTNNSISIVENSLEVEAIHSKQAKKTEELSKNISTISDQLNEIKVDIDSTQQKLKEANVRLVGLPENHSCDAEDIKVDIIKFAQEQLALPTFDPEDIEEVSRLGKVSESKTRDVLITFKNKASRNRFYNRRRKLYDANTRTSPSGVYINEDLTSYRQRLYYDGRHLRKKGTNHSVWTSAGTIMIKITENSQPQPILTHRDIAVLLRKNSVKIRDIDEEQS